MLILFFVLFLHANRCMLLSLAFSISNAPPPSTYTHTHTRVNMHIINFGDPEHLELRSKSLEEEKKDRRISWGVNGEEERRRAAGKRRFSEELKRRRHTVSGDERDSR